MTISVLSWVGLVAVVSAGIVAAVIGAEWLFTQWLKWVVNPLYLYWATVFYLSIRFRRDKDPVVAGYALFQAYERMARENPAVANDFRRRFLQGEGVG